MTTIQRDEVSLVHGKGYVCHGRYISISISFFGFNFLVVVAFFCTFKSNHTSLYVLSVESLHYV